MRKPQFLEAAVTSVLLRTKDEDPVLLRATAPLKFAAAAVRVLFNCVVPVTARALEPIVAPPIAKDVALAEPSDGLKLEDMVHAMVSTISLSAQAVPRTTVEPVVAVYSDEESLEPL